MNTPEKITLTAMVNAEKNKVWSYYTNPQHIKQWNFADPSWHCPAASNDLAVGGRYHARMEAMDGSFGFDFDAVYTAVNPGESFTYEFGGRSCTVSFNDKEGRTEVRVTFDPEEEHSRELQQNGWQAILDNFKNYTEAG